jgi:hypothetical protein
MPHFITRCRYAGLTTGKVNGSRAIVSKKRAKRVVMMSETFSRVFRQRRRAVGNALRLLAAGARSCRWNGHALGLLDRRPINPRGEIVLEDRRYLAKQMEDVAPVARIAPSPNAPLDGPTSSMKVCMRC